MNLLICVPGNQFSNKFLRCWTSLLGYCNGAGINIIFSNNYSSNVYFARSSCLGADVRRGINQLPFDGKIEYDYMLWIDSDIIFQVEDFVSIINHRDRDVISGLYLMDGGREYTAVINWNVDYFISNGSFEFLKPEDDIIRRGELFTVEYSGMGFMLVKRGVFEKIKYPWFEPQFTKFKDEIYDFCSEDVGFCKKCIKNGFQIWIDPKIQVKHEKSILY